MLLASMKTTRIPVLLAVWVAAIVVAAESDRAAVRFTVTEEVHVNGALDTFRSEVFIPAVGLTNTTQLHLESTNGAAFLNLTDLRTAGTNLWFRKWEYGRKPPPEGTRSPFYMIKSGSMSFETSQEHHLVIGDSEGLRQWHKHMQHEDGTTIQTYLVLKAEMN